MIFIDARDGLSGDMLLAAMLGLMTDERRRDLIARIGSACSKRGIDLRLLELEEEGEKGLGVAYIAREERPAEERSRDDAYAALAGIEREIGSGSPVGRRILDLIFEAEAKAHGVPVDRVHLHEIGRMQALVNIAGIGAVAAELDRKGTEEFVCSTIVTGRGTVVVSHGVIRIPAPASAHLLDGLIHEPGQNPGERATPTGIAAARALMRRQSEDPPERSSARSTGFGTRRFGGRLGRTTLIRA
jgi:hypothetical protein